MLIGEKFSGDSNKVLMKEQHRLYGDMLACLHGKPRDRYLDACRVTLVDTDREERLPWRAPPTSPFFQVAQLAVLIDTERRHTVRGAAKPNQEAENAR